VPAEPAFARRLEHPPISPGLTYQSVAARTQGQNLTAPGRGISGIAVAGSHRPLAGGVPGAEGAALHGLILRKAVADLLDRSGNNERDERGDDHKLSVEQNADEPAPGVEPVREAPDHGPSCGHRRP